MQTTFEVGEQHSDGFDPLLVRQVFQSFFSDVTGRCALEAVTLGLQVQRLQLFIREGKKIPILLRHGSPFVRAGALWIDANPGVTSIMSL